MNKVGIIMGSDSDLDIMKESARILDEFDIPYELTIISAHRTPERMIEFAKSAYKKGLKVIIAGAGGAAHVPGMIAALTPVPVIGVPLKGKSLDGLDSLLSIVQMPPGIPVATVSINGAKNAGILALSIIGVNDERIFNKLLEYKKNMEKEVLRKAEKLNELKYEKYLAMNNMDLNQKLEYKLANDSNHNNIVKEVDLNGFGKRYSGKVRDYYIVGDKRIIITTDRISAFDVILGFIPSKGAVLNQLSAFWFEKTKNIIDNHFISMPHSNVMVVKNVKLIPIEMVVRGYITGVTNTSIWGSYERGEREIYGIKFPDGLLKNQKLKIPVITPTTKAEKGHDERLTEKIILKKKIVDPVIWKQMKKTALELFKYGTDVCEKAGIILVDTKYEFGLDSKGKLILIDEIHTPDSSRFWIKKTYKDRFKKGLEPQSFDKEFLRLWYAKRGYKGDGLPPKMPFSLIEQVSQRYIQIYKKITGNKIRFDEKISESMIRKNLN